MIVGSRYNRPVGCEGELGTTIGCQNRGNEGRVSTVDGRVRRAKRRLFGRVNHDAHTGFGVLSIVSLCSTVVLPYSTRSGTLRRKNSDCVKSVGGIAFLLDLSVVSLYLDVFLQCKVLSDTTFY